MLIASHILVAGYVGERIGNPVLAFLVGFIIHFILDAIPHYDTTDDGKLTFRQIVLIGIDGLIAIFILYFIFRNNSLNASFISGAIGGALPDIIDNVPLWKKAFRATFIGKKFHGLHEKVHSAQPSLIIGLSFQIVVIIVFTLLLLQQ